MLFAKIDVCFWRHPKFIEAGLEACGYWAGCLTWLRENDSPDGIVPDSLLGHILDVGSKKASQICTKLVVVGLFEREANGYHLLRYEDKNETKEEIEARKERSRERSSKWRAAKAISVPPPADGDASLTRSSQVSGDAYVPDSGSGSGSDREIQKEVGVAEGTLFSFDESRLPLTEERKAIGTANTTVQEIDATWQKFTLMAVEKNWRFDSRGWDARWQRFCLDEAKYQRVARERAAGWQGGSGNGSLEAARSPSRKKLAPLQRPAQE
jgi:hypothetical protein